MAQAAKQNEEIAAKLTANTVQHWHCL